MYKIKTINNISPLGLDKLKALGYDVAPDIENPDGIIVRSADMHGYVPNPELLGVARAGAGYNNIPVEEYAEKGIVVFNSPGANAEAVKEQSICSLVLASRDVLGSIKWVRSIAGEGDNIPALVEKGKSDFAGPELMGKTIGVLGLGATGALLANACLALDMNVIGYDPFMSVESAWRLSREVKRADDLSEIYHNCDYISINIPYNEQTHHLIDDRAFQLMKDGVRIINESRAEVVDDDAMLKALESGKVAKYVTDFPNAKILTGRNVIALPHLGACTPESEDRCAEMAAKQLHEYLKNGNIVNSVNLPTAKLERMGVCRLCVLHHNVPGMINRILDLITEMNINVEHMINKPKGKYAYTIIDLNDEIWDDTAEKIRKMDDVLRVRIL